MKFFRRKQKRKSVPHVWITINGLPFYVPVTAPEVELAYGIAEANRLRREKI